MNITHVIPGFSKGGGERVAVDLANYSEQAGHSISIVAAVELERSVLLDQLRPDAPVRYIGSRAGTRWAAYAKLGSWIAANREWLAGQDVVHCHLTFGAVFATLVYCQRRLLRRRAPAVVETNHSVGMPIPRFQRALWPKASLLRDAVALMAEEPYWNGFRGAHPELLTQVILNGVDPPRRSPHSRQLSTFAAFWLLQCHQFPRSGFDVNIVGALNVMEACVRRGVKRLVFSSFAAVYGDDLPSGPLDRRRLGAKDMYGASKIAAEALLTAYHHRYGLDFVGLRYVNAYGPRQNYRGSYLTVIMKMLDAIDRGESPVVLGNGSDSIDFIAVEDCARANLKAMEAEATDRFYDVCTGRPTSLRELAELLLEITGSSLRIVQRPRPKSDTGRSRLGDPVPAREEIGFTAATRLREGLERLIAWRNADRRARGAETYPSRASRITSSASGASG